MTVGNFWGCGKLLASDWLFYLGYVPFQELCLMPKLTLEGFSITVAFFVFAASKLLHIEAASEHGMGCN